MRAKAFWVTALVVLCGLTTAGGVAANGGSAAPVTSLVGVHSTKAALPTPLSPTSWVAGAAYPSTITRYAFAQAGSDLYVLGGVSDGTVVTTMNRYNASTNMWTPRAALPFMSEAPSAAYSNGKIYLAEGGGGSSFAIYNIASNTWSSGTARPVADGYGAAAGAYNGKVYVVGGGSSGPGSSVTSIYNIASNTWSPGTAAPTAFYLAGYHQSGQYLYIVGGFNGSSVTNLTETMRLDMSNGTWSSGPAFTPQRADFALAMSGTKLYAIGGDANGGGFFDSLATVNELDTSSWPGGAWAASPNDLPSVRQGNEAGFFSTGRAGGEIWSTGGIQGATFTFLPDHVYRQQVPSIAINDARVLEGDSGTKNMTFTVSLSAPAPITTTVHFATANGTAVSGADYNQTAGTVTFTAGQDTKTINVAIVGEKIAEADETVLVNLSSPSEGLITDSQGQGTILDDDSFRYTAATPSFPGFAGGATDSGNHCDDCATSITAPFPISFYGTSSTALSVSSNGLLSLGGSAAPATFTNSCLPTTNGDRLLAPYWDDQVTNMPAGAGIFTSVSGAPPNRVFTIEWRTSNFPGGATIANDYTVRFFENSPTIQVLYSPTMGNGASATIGVQRTSLGLFTQYSCNVSHTLTSSALDFVALLAPAATTSAASGVTASGATVNGSVNPQSQATTAFFQYGPTTAYGSSTASLPAGSGSSSVPLSVALGALPSGTTFHFRIVATNATGTRIGADQTFTTAVTLAVTKAGSGSGVVTSAPAGIACGATCSAIFATGTSVTLTAAPSKKNTFLGWSGECTGTGPCVLSMTADRAVTATFKKPLTPPACKVPKVVGLKLAKAKTRIKKAHCRVGKVTKKTSPANKKGKVLKQSPKAGKKLKNGGKVKLTVGKGP
jgi:hypothetical protein